MSASFFEMSAAGRMGLGFGIAISGLAGLWIFSTSPVETSPAAIEKTVEPSPVSMAVKAESAAPGGNGALQSRKAGALAQNPAANTSHHSPQGVIPIAAAGSPDRRIGNREVAPVPRSNGLEIVEIHDTSLAGGQGTSVGGGPGPAREISLPVPEGEKVPAVFFDAAEKPLSQQKALDRIAEEFERNVSEVPPGLTRKEVWEAARRIADERYLTLFGYQAYNHYHIQAAKEALKEKRASSQEKEPQ